MTMIAIDIILTWLYCFGGCNNEDNDTNKNDFVIQRINTILFKSGP